jgi:sugar phosphate permease
MIKDLQITKAQAGMIKSAFSMVYLLFTPFMGWLTDRIGGRRVISFFCLFLGAGTFLMGKAESLTSSVIFYSIVGIGAAATWVPIATIIQRWFGIKKRGFALGLLSSSYGLGYGLMGFILPTIVLTYHWRIGWFILGIAGFSLFVLNGLFVREQPQKMGLSPWGEALEDRKKVTSSRQNREYAEILKRGRFWIIGISYFAIAYGTYAVIDFIVTMESWS